MRWLPIRLAAVGLCIALLPLAGAKADPAMQLQNITFNDGGTAVGYFDLNVYGYLSDFNLATTSGSILAGNTYIAGGPVGTPPSNSFTFNTTGSVFDLVLDLAAPLGFASGGADAIIPGSAAGSVLAGSYEVCVSNQVACGVPFGTARLITSGDVYAPEPTALSLLAAGVVLTSVARRRGRDAA